jgi:hypothetical protein
MQEEEEAEVRGMSASKYREFALDVFFKAFYLLGRIYKEQGENLIFDLIIAEVSSVLDPLIVESGIFAAKSIIDALKECPTHNTFIGKMFELILINPFKFKSRSLTKQSILFINEASIYFKVLPTMILQILNFLIEATVYFRDSHSIIFKTIMEICLKCKEKFGDNEFNVLYTFLE